MRFIDTNCFWNSFFKKESNDIVKIIFFIERLCESDGMNIIIQSLLSFTKLVYGKNFDILSLFKEYYISYSNLKNNDDDDIYKKIFLKIFLCNFFYL